MKTHLLGVGALLCVLPLTAGCGSVVQADCQTLPSAQGGYVLRFTRSGAAAAGCETQTPAETSDIWVFDTLADSQIRAHAVSMPYADPPVDPLPPGLIGAGKFTTREADANNRCQVESLTTMSNGSGASLRSYATRNMEWLGGAAYQGAEFKAEATVTVGACTAAYTVQALSPAVGCESDNDCDPFKQPFSSGIFSSFDQGCSKAAWTTPTAALLGTSGVCFFNQPYPSLK